MKFILNGGLSLNDPFALSSSGQDIAESETALSENADYRQDGVVRSRNGMGQIYTSVGTDLIDSANGHVYSFGTYMYQNGTSLGTLVSSPVVAGKAHLYNSTTEALFLSSAINYKIVDSTVSIWGLNAPTIAPTLALSGTGLTGTYYFKYTYVVKVGATLIHESNPSPVSLATSPADQSVEVTYTTPSDSQVTHIRIYRTLTDQTADFYYDGEIEVGLGAYTTSVADSALGSQVEVDNDPPLDGIVAIAGPGAYNNLFIGIGNKVYFSKPARPESFPALYYNEIGTPYFPIQALVDWGGLLYVFTKDGVYYLQGTSYNTYYPTRTLASMGLFARHAIVPTEKGIMYLGGDGLYAFNGQNESKLTDAKVDPIFRGETVNGINPLNRDKIATCWLQYFNGKLFFGYPDANESTPSKVLVYDFLKSKFSIYDYGKNLKSAFVDRVNNRLLVGDTTGVIWRLEYGENDGGEEFTFKIRSKELTSIEGFSPSLVRYNVKNDGGSLINLRLLNKGDAAYTYTFTDTEDIKRRHLPPMNIESLQIEFETSTASRVELGVINLE